MDLDNMRSLGVTKVDVYCGCGHNATIVVSYNTYRVHRSLGGSTPAHFAGVSPAVPTSLDHHVWGPHCRGLFQTPVAA
jgi:hypothetical protein